MLVVVTSDDAAMTSDGAVIIRSTLQITVLSGAYGEDSTVSTQWVQSTVM